MHGGAQQIRPFRRAYGDSGRGYAAVFSVAGGKWRARREYFKDRFVIFSGGKFELRKGQDIVIRAVKIMQDRHHDVVLVNSWFNAWQQSIDTMSARRICAGRRRRASMGKS